MLNGQMPSDLQLLPFPHCLSPADLLQYLTELCRPNLHSHHAMSDGCSWTCTLNMGVWEGEVHTEVRNSPSGTMTFQVLYFSSSRGSPMA